MNIDKIKEIFNAWRISYDPTKAQAELAAERIQICDECEHKETIEIGNVDLLTRCNLCGCTLKLKIYTEKTYQDAEISCPLMKWVIPENSYLQKKNANDKQV